MRFKLMLMLGASLLAMPFAPAAYAQDTSAQDISAQDISAQDTSASAPYVQLAELDIDPSQLDAYRAAVSEHIHAAIRAEPGVLVLYAVAHKDNPARITVFEVYKDTAAYKAHLEAAHFKKYKATVETMVKSLKLVPATPVVLGAK
jgi:quinol monooxygenase YgiN